MSWLDTGCGTGTLIAKAAGCFNGVNFVAADPSPAMLEQTREKLVGLTVEYVETGTEAFSMKNRFDVVTAIMSHHYLNMHERDAATKNCFDALNEGGVYVTFETIRPFSERGTEVGLQRWRTHQLSNGKAPEEVDKHISRYGMELLPISIDNHLELLRRAGFSTVEILWVSGLQAGFYAVK